MGKDPPPPHVRAKMLAELAAAFTPGTDPVEMERPVLYSVYGSDIVVRLERIWEQRSRDPASSYIVVSVRGRTPGYVTCQLNGDEQLLLEASVGPYPPKSGQLMTAASPVIVASLENNGYRRNQAGRFFFPFEISEPDQSVWGAAAVAIINPLIDAFGARAGSRIEIIAPLALERDETAIRQQVTGGAEVATDVFGPFEEAKLVFPEINDELLALAAKEIPEGTAEELQRGLFYGLHMHDLQERLARIHGFCGSAANECYLLASMTDEQKGSVRAWFDASNDALYVEPVLDLEHASRFTLRLAPSMRAEDFEEAAIALLDFLVDAFGASPKSQITITAPLAPERDDRAVISLILRSEMQGISEH